MAWPAMTKPDGRVFVGLQRHVQSGDVSRDLAVALLCALQTEPGGTVVGARPARRGPAAAGRPGRRRRWTSRMHDGFEFWLDDDAGRRPEREGVPGAGERLDLPDRAARGGPGRVLVPGARQGARALGAAGRRGRGAGRAGPAVRVPASCCSARTPSSPGCSARTACSCRSGTCPGEPDADDWEAPLADFAKRYADALADTAPLDARRPPRQAGPASAASSPCAELSLCASAPRTLGCACALLLS